MKEPYLRYKGYRAKVSYDGKNDTLSGEVIGLSDDISFEGKSLEDLKESYAKAVDKYLKECAEAGKDPDREYTGVFNVRISPELHRRIDDMAREKGASINKIVTEALEGYAYW